jgi:hypothetical protein
MELAVLVQDIHRLSHELERLERKYGIMSATFYEWYTSGEEPANDAWVLDFEKWAGLYEVWCDRQRAYSEALKTVRRQHVPFHQILRPALA